MTETFNNLHNGVQEKDRLEKAYNESLGSPACTRLLKKKQSSWNGFVKDKWGPKFEEVKGLPDYEGKSIRAVSGEVMRQLGNDWSALSPETKQEYPVFGHGPSSKKRKLGDEMIPPKEISKEIWKAEKRKLFSTIVRAMRELDQRYGVCSAWVYGEKDLHGESGFSLSTDDPHDPIARYWEQLVGRGLDHHCLGTYSKAAYGGIRVTDHVPTVGKRCDNIRHDFKRLLIKEYNAFALSQSAPVLSITRPLPAHFFTTFLSKKRWGIEGLNVSHFRDDGRTPTDVLEAAIQSLIRGDVRFVRLRDPEQEPQTDGIDSNQGNLPEGAVTSVTGVQEPF